MPHLETILPNAIKSCLDFASVVVRSRIYICFLQYVEAKNNGRTRQKYLKICLLDDSDSRPRLLEVSKTPASDLHVGTSICYACSDEDAILILKRFLARNRVTIYLARRFDTVTRTWSRIKTDVSLDNAGDVLACQVGRAIFVNTHVSGKLREIYCLHLHSDEWILRNVYEFDMDEEEDYARCSSWKHFFVILRSFRLRVKSPLMFWTYIWKASVLNTTNNKWLPHQISFTPPISCVVICAVTYENSLIVFGKPMCRTHSSTFAIYALDLERYTWSTVGHFDLALSSAIASMQCLPVNNLIYCFSWSSLKYSSIGTMNIHVLNMKSKSLTMHCMTKVHDMELEVNRLPSTLNIVDLSNIPKL